MDSIANIARLLSRDETGIWRAAHSSELSYPSDGNANCFEIEDDSFWFRHRNACITTLVRALPPPDQGAVFDVGGGNGFVSLGLQQAGFDVVLVEPGPEGALNGRKRGLDQVICATLDDAGLKPGVLPAVGLFDVIEHIEDDSAFVRSIASHMRPGGRLYATVPLSSLLWSSEDVHAGHFRRYSLNSIQTLLQSTGFKVEYATRFFRWLPVPIFLVRALPYRLGIRRQAPGEASSRREHAAGSQGVSKAADKMFRSELAQIRSLKPMRFGASALIAATLESR